MPNKETDNPKQSFRSLHRSTTNRVIAGVAGGLGEYFDIDPTIIRIAFILLTVFGGSGVIIYLVLWLIMPSSDSQGPDHVRKSINEVRDRFKRFASDLRIDPNSNQRRTWFGIIILVIGLAFLLDNFGFGIHLGRLWPLVLIVLGFMVLSKR